MLFVMSLCSVSLELFIKSVKKIAATGVPSLQNADCFSFFIVLMLDEKRVSQHHKYLHKSTHSIFFVLQYEIRT